MKYVYLFRSDLGFIAIWIPMCNIRRQSIHHRGDYLQWRLHSIKYLNKSDYLESFHLKDGLRERFVNCKRYHRILILCVSKDLSIHNVECAETDLHLPYVVKYNPLFVITLHLDTGFYTKRHARYGLGLRVDFANVCNVCPRPDRGGSTKRCCSMDAVVLFAAEDLVEGSAFSIEWCLRALCRLCLARWDISVAMTRSTI